MTRLRAIAGENTVEVGPRIRLVAFDEVQLSLQRRGLIKGLIPRVGLTVVWGAKKSCKSFWTFDAMMHVALGWKYRGRRVHRGPVVYCVLEGHGGLDARKAAFEQRFLAEEREPVPLYFVPVALDLVGDHLELIAVIRQHLAPAVPVAVVLDTLNRSLRGSESSDEDMTAYVAAADAIRDAFACSVIIVHHCGVDESRPRGHTALMGAVDAQLSVKRDSADNVVVTLELAKDGPQGEVIVSRLEVVEVGRDEDEEPITSCVIVPAERAAVEAAKPKASLRLNVHEQLALRSISYLIDRGQCQPAPPVDGVTPGTLAVKCEAVREQAFRTGFCQEGEPGGTVRSRWSRTLAGLVAKQKARVHEGVIWPV